MGGSEGWGCRGYMGMWIYRGLCARGNVWRGVENVSSWAV